MLFSSSEKFNITQKKALFLKYSKLKSYFLSNDNLLASGFLILNPARWGGGKTDEKPSRKNHQGIQKKTCPRKHAMASSKASYKNNCDQMRRKDKMGFKRTRL